MPIHQMLPAEETQTGGELFSRSRPPTAPAIEAARAVIAAAAADGIEAAPGDEDAEGSGDSGAPVMQVSFATRDERRSESGAMDGIIFFCRLGTDVLGSLKCMSGLESAETRPSLTNCSWLRLMCSSLSSS